MLLPACEAVIEQVPAAINVAVVPLTVQTVCVVDAKLTVSPELAVAANVRGVPTVCVAGVAKVIVCAAGVAASTVKLLVTGAAAAYVLLPACEAVIEQVPTAKNVTVVPLTVQTVCVVDEKLTARPEVAVAANVRDVPTVCVAGAAKVIVCAAGVAASTVKLLVTGAAAAYVLLPACEAVIEQVPTAMNVAVVPLTVQVCGVSDAKATGSPELAVAMSVIVEFTV
jgi:hypothetical protein